MDVKIAGTTMTTLRPNIGTVPGKDKTEFGFKIADLPGLIDGAHAGKGVGEHFLSMIERNSVEVKNISIVWLFFTVITIIVQPPEEHILLLSISTVFSLTKIAQNVMLLTL